jgi:hypothetical protein
MGAQPRSSVEAAIKAACRIVRQARQAELLLVEPAALSERARVAAAKRVEAPGPTAKWQRRVPE